MNINASQKCSETCLCLWSLARKLKAAGIECSQPTSMWGDDEDWNKNLVSFFSCDLSFRAPLEVLVSHCSVAWAAVTSLNWCPPITDTVKNMTSKVCLGAELISVASRMQAKCGWACRWHFPLEFGSCQSQAHVHLVSGSWCASDLFGQQAFKKERGAKNRETEMHNAAQPAPVSLCSFLLSLFGQWSPPTRCLVFPPLHSLPSWETWSTRCLFTFFQPHSLQTSCKRSVGLLNLCCPHVWLKSAHTATFMTFLCAVGAQQGAEAWLSEWQDSWMCM